MAALIPDGACVIVLHASECQFNLTQRYMIQIVSSELLKSSWSHVQKLTLKDARFKY